MNGDWSIAQVARREAENILREPDTCSLELVALAEEYQKLRFEVDEPAQEMTAADIGCVVYECQQGLGDPPMDCIAPHCPCGEIKEFMSFAYFWWHMDKTKRALELATRIVREEGEKYEYNTFLIDIICDKIERLGE